MKPLQMLPIAALVGSIFGNPVLAADEAATETTPVKAEIKEVRVKGQRNAATTVERVNARTIQEQMIRDTRDLVRYSSDVGVSDDGRRMKGFAMRGVEDNRVGISIDGVALPSSEENSLYARYGNFNNSRLSIDTELVKGVDITKGADSFESGSGSLGGNVNYRTLDARDIVLPEQNFGALLRSGYASKNREWANTVGFGYAGNVFDAVVLYSRRHGHEMKSRGGDVVDFVGSGELDKQDKAERGSARIHPDPSKHNNHSYLVKLGWQPSDSHRFGFSVNGQNNSNYTYEKTYSLTGYWREADDVQKRTNINLNHEWTPASSVLALLRTDLDYQKTRNGAINYKGDMVLGNWDTGFQYHNGFMAGRDERNMDTKYKRITFRLDSQPFSLWKSEHRLSFKTFASRRDFENVNDDLAFNSAGDITRRKHYTIMRPMKTDQIGFSLQDKIALGDKFSVNAGVRYDHEKVKPQAFKPDTPCLSTCVNDGNPAARSFNTWNGVFGLDYRFNDTWRAAYQINTGHRVPTASEMYFTYTSVYGNWIANPSLKAERSLNQTLSLHGKNDKGSLDFSLYQTRYRNFLFEEEHTFQIPNPYNNHKDKWYYCDTNPTYCGMTISQIGQQMVNVDKARVRGIEFKGELNLHQVMPVPEGFKLSGALGYSKGKLSGDRGSMLSIQPLKLVLGFDYESPDERWGIFSRVSHMGRKKAKDAQITEQNTYCTRWEFDPWYGEERCKVEEYREDKIDFRWLNKAATVVDVFGYYKPVKRMTLRAGVYNLFNRKYHTWDSLRGINPRSTINSLSVRDAKSAAQGLERYYAPGRNYAVSLEWKF